MLEITFWTFPETAAASITARAPALPGTCGGMIGAGLRGPSATWRGQRLIMGVEPTSSRARCTVDLELA